MILPYVRVVGKETLDEIAKAANSNKFSPAIRDAFRKMLKVAGAGIDEYVDVEIVSQDSLTNQIMFSNGSRIYGIPQLMTYRELLRCLNYPPDIVEVKDHISIRI